MKGCDLLALANGMADQGADDQSLQLLLSSASKMLTMDIDGEKAKAKKRLAMSTYYPPNKDSSPSSSARPALGSTPRSPSPSAKDPSAALLSASQSSAIELLDAARGGHAMPPVAVLPHAQKVPACDKTAAGGMAWSPSAASRPRTSKSVILASIVSHKRYKVRRFISPPRATDHKEERLMEVPLS